MTRSKLLWAALTVLAAGACRMQSSGGHGMRRPDIGRDWTWAGDAIPTGDMTTSLLTLEHMVPSNLRAGQDCSYTVRVTNISKTPIRRVVVSDDTAQSGFELSQSTPEASRMGSVLRWDLGTLQPGAVEEIQVAGRAGPTGEAPCCSHVAYAEAERPKPAPAPTPVAPPPAMGGLELSKTEPTDTCVYDDIPIRLVVKNPGKGQATDVKVTDELPDGWTVDGKKSVTFNVGTLAPGASKELSARAHSARTGSFTNHATATASGGLSANASSRTNVHKATLQVTKTGPRSSVILGRAATFNITVKNTGDWTAADCTVKDTMSGADSVTAASDRGSISGSTVTWNLGNLAAGESRSLTVSATRSTGGAIQNTATASARCAEPATASASANFIGIAAVLLEMADDPDPVPVGGTTTYTIRVTNQGTAADSEIVVTCTMEDAVEFVSAAGVTRGTHAGATVTFAPLARLAPKEVATWTVVVRGVKAADSRFKIVLDTKETGRPIEKTEATRIYE